MRTEYRVDGMHCNKCLKRVADAVSALPGARDVAVDMASGHLSFDTQDKVSIEQVRSVLAAAGNYSVRTFEGAAFPGTSSLISRVVLLAPLIGMIALVSVLALIRNAPPFAEHFHSHGFMLDFMAGFFLLFGALKLVNLRAFAAMYSRYDVLAALVPVWGYIVPFVEVVLGFGYLFRTSIVPVSIATMLLMGIGSIGVWRKLRARDPVTCACLGGFFNVPVSPLTLAENLIMVTMAAAMLA